MGTRDHEPFVIEEFNGLWDRGSDETCPSDHLLTANNVQYAESAIMSRFPLDIYQVGQPAALRNIQRVYNYVTQTGQSLLVLVPGGNIYHVVAGAIKGTGPILTIPAMEDFGFVSINGRAYITPFKTFVDANGQNYELGLPNEHVYVYGGDGLPARKAGGTPPTAVGPRPFIVYPDTAPGVVTKGFHLIICVFSPSGLYYPTTVQVVDAPGDRKVQLTNIPVGPDGTTERTVIMTHAINPNDVVHSNTYPWWDALKVPGNEYVTIKLDKSDAELTVGSGWTGPYFPPLMPFLQGQTPNPGFCDIGFHIMAVVFETDTGHLSALGPEYFCANTNMNVKTGIIVYGIPTSPNPNVVKRHLVSTKAIFDYNGDQKGYQFFFIPGGTLDSVQSSVEVSYYDSDLVDDASHLVDNYEFIPAGVNLTTYHSRMVVVGINTLPSPIPQMAREVSVVDNRSVALLSAPGEPESVSQIDGLIITPLDGNPLTNAQEFRDILYLFKKTRTYGYSDTAEEPATWVEEVIDQGIGAPVHGIASVLDSGGVNTDFLLVTDWSGLMLFNGTYARPELSFKIDDFWMLLTRNNFRQIQIVNDSLALRIYMTLPDPYRNFILYADYGNGMNAKTIRWSKWIFDANMSSVALIDSNKLILGAL
jgi:hypothetical protein